MKSVVSIFFVLAVCVFPVQATEVSIMPVFIEDHPNLYFDIERNVLWAGTDLIEGEATATLTIKTVMTGYSGGCKIINVTFGNGIGSVQNFTVTKAPFCRVYTVTSNSVGCNISLSAYLDIDDETVYWESVVMFGVDNEPPQFGVPVWTVLTEKRENDFLSPLLFLSSLLIAFLLGASLMMIRNQKLIKKLRWGNRKE